ncbi:reverse transcriptase domain-containing protein, partial [Thiolapillus sp.]
MKKEKYDIVAIQESHITTDEEAAQWELLWGGTLFYSSGTARSLGQMLLINRNLMHASELIYKEERIIVVKLKIDDKTILVVNAYAPNNTTGKIEFFRHLGTVIDRLATDTTGVILMGDFNSVMNNNEDIISGNKHNIKEVQALNQLVVNIDAHDVWRLQNEEAREYTWNRSHPFTARRIDYIFVTSPLLPYVESSRIISFALSDHRAVESTFKFHNFKRGPSYWKFNNNLLKDTTFVENTNQLLEALQNQHQGLTPHAKWEITKIKIKEHSINYATTKAKHKKNRKTEMATRLNELEKQLAKQKDNEGLEKEVIKLKAELEINELAKALGAQTRSRIKFIEEGEKNTAFFLALEKSKATSNTITSIVTEDGQQIKDQTSLLAEQVRFYKALYMEDTSLQNTEVTYIPDFLGTDAKLPILENNEKSQCEGQISDTEASKALKDMKNGSAPGSDGLTTEFYKFFWLKIKNILIESFSHSFEVGHVSQSQQRGIVTLLHKGKHLARDKLTNWRPITLLNTDYKILAKIMANRLNRVISNLVDNDQCGFLKGRNIATILRTTDDVISYLNSKQLPGLLVAIDFTKAFDTISKKLIVDCLKQYGFGPEFIHWVQTLISQSESCVSHYGWLSEPFQVERGIRQGCPFSPLLFVLAVELLAVKIRSGKIKGITIRKNGHEITIKIQQFADDTTLYLRDKEDLDKAMKIFEAFASISGLQMSLSKTEAMWLGQNSHKTETFYNIAWVRQTKILGIYFRNDKSASEIEENWLTKVSNMKRIIKQWSRRNLSIYGKILIAKTYIISQFIYTMQSIGLPERVLSSINHTLYTFIWKKKNSNKKAFEKVKRKVLMQDYDKGGLKMIDMKILQSALYLSWIPKLITKSTDKWKVFPKIYYSQLGEGLSILHTPCVLKDLMGYPRKEGEFWKNVLDNWIQVRKSAWSGTKQLNLNSALWNNNNFQYKNRNLHLKEWMTAGIF